MEIGQAATDSEGNIPWPKSCRNVFPKVAAFIGGMNFYSVLNFFLLTYETVYIPTSIRVGLYGLGYGFSVACGAALLELHAYVIQKSK
jgi:hypothetical protein